MKRKSSFHSWSPDTQFPFPKAAFVVRFLCILQQDVFTSKKFYRKGSFAYRLFCILLLYLKLHLGICCILIHIELPSSFEQLHNIPLYSSYNYLISLLLMSL